MTFTWMFPTCRVEDEVKAESETHDHSHHDHEHHDHGMLYLLIVVTWSFSNLCFNGRLRKAAGALSTWNLILHLPHQDVLCLVSDTDHHEHHHGEDHNHGHEHGPDCAPDCGHDHADGHIHDHVHDPGVSSVSIVCGGNLDIDKVKPTASITCNLPGDPSQSCQKFIISCLVRVFISNIQLIKFRTSCCKRTLCERM